MRIYFVIGSAIFKVKKKSYNHRVVKRDHSVLGYALVIVCSLLLLCISITPIFGVVSTAIFNVTLGVFGIIAYPILISLILLGIAYIKHLPVYLPVRKIVAICCLSFFAILLLQLATTHHFLTRNFADYIAATYSAKYSAGGVIFGTIAYGIQKGITEIASYVIYSVIIIALAVYISGIVPKLLNRNATVTFTKQPPNLPVPSFPTSPDHSVATKQPQSKQLYVGVIEPSESSLATVSRASEITPSQERSMSMFESSPMFSDISRPLDISSEKAKALELLYGNQYDAGLNMIEEFERQKSVSKTKSPVVRLMADIPEEVKPDTQPTPSTAAPVVQSAPQEKPDVQPEKSARPQMITHDANSLLAEVILPKPKDYETAYTENEIINADEVSRRLRELQEQEKRGRVDAERILSESARRESEAQSILKKAPTFDENAFISRLDADDDIEELAPIIVANAKPVTEPVETVPEKPTVKPADTRESLTLSPKSSIESAPASYYQVNRDDELHSVFKQEMQKSSVTAPIDETVDDEPLSPIIVANQIKQELVSEDGSDKLVIDNSEAEDKSEKGENLPVDDFSGMSTYEEIAPPPKKSRVPENQISMDMYVQQRAETVLSNIPARKSFPHFEYNKPSIDFLNIYNDDVPEEDLEENARRLEECLKSYGVQIRVEATHKGPAITEYEVTVPPGVPISSVSRRSDDIMYALGAKSIRIQAPIPGRSAIGIEVPNKYVSTIGLRDIIESRDLDEACKTQQLPLALGVDVSGKPLIKDLAEMPHLLVAGTTGSGKSACLNCIIMSILYQKSPEEVRFILVDPKRVEFSTYNNMPHLLFNQIVYDAQQFLNVLKWTHKEMERRYALLSKNRVTTLSMYNALDSVRNGSEEKLQRIVIIVDEFADLMFSPEKGDLEKYICALAQKSRAAGIHMIIATQRPSADVITGTIKSNLNTRIAFRVAQGTESRIILDNNGAEDLMGKGDMLYYTGQMTRAQGAFVALDEISLAVSHIKDKNPSYFDDTILKDIMQGNREESEGDSSSGQGGKERTLDPIFERALAAVICQGQASVSMLQRRFNVGYPRAGKIIDQLADAKYIAQGVPGSNKPREVYMTREQYEEIYHKSVEDPL